LTGEVIVLSVRYYTAYPAIVILGCERFLLVCCLLMVMYASGPGLSAFGLGRGNAAAGIKRGLLWSAYCGLATLVFFSVLYASHISPLSIIKTPLPDSLQDLVIFFTVGGVIAPIAEEIFFRGIVYGFLRKWGVVMAIIGTTAVFVAAHSLRTDMPLPQIVGGILFAVAYEAEGNILAPITIHVVGNSAIFALSLMGNVA
jgi:membrane protease YdiL (CAAX protease family)